MRLFVGFQLLPLIFILRCSKCNSRLPISTAIPTWLEMYLEYDSEAVNCYLKMFIGRVVHLVLGSLVLRATMYDFRHTSRILWLSCFVAAARCTLRHRWRTRCGIPSFFCCWGLLVECPETNCCTFFIFFDWKYVLVIFLLTYLLFRSDILSGHTHYL